jgi:hypothetical protein
LVLNSQTLLLVILVQGGNWLWDSISLFDLHSLLGYLDLHLGSLLSLLKGSTLGVFLVGISFLVGFSVTLVRLDGLAAKGVDLVWLVDLVSIGLSQLLVFGPGLFFGQSLGGDSDLVL